MCQQGPHEQNLAPVSSVECADGEGGADLNPLSTGWPVIDTLGDRFIQLFDSE